MASSNLEGLGCNWGEVWRRGGLPAPPVINRWVSFGRACSAAGAAGVGMVGHEGHQGNLSGPLNGGPEGTLVLGADTGAAARLDLGPF